MSAAAERTPPARASDAASAGPCELAEVVQYHCQPQETRIVCQPVERIFQMCARRPAVEVTHLVEYTPQGEPYLPVPLP